MIFTLRSSCLPFSLTDKSPIVVAESFFLKFCSPSPTKVKKLVKLSIAFNVNELALEIVSFRKLPMKLLSVK